MKLEKSKLIRTDVEPYAFNKAATIAMKSSYFNRRGELHYHNMTARNRLWAPMVDSLMNIMEPIKWNYEN